MTIDVIPTSDNTPLDRLLPLPEVMALVSLARSPLQRLIAEGEFPRPIKIGKAARWSLMEVQNWIKEKCNQPRETSYKVKLIKTNNNAA